MRIAANPVQASAHKHMPAKWRVCIVLSALALLATYWPHALETFRLDRNLFFSGEVWRLLSGHLVHMNTPHLMLNLLALFLLCELLWLDLDWRQAVGLLLFAAFATAAALLTWHPGLAWYAGLSGVLHGLWAGCALHGLQAATSAASPTAPSGQARWSTQRRICAVALALLCLKLALEFHYGPSQRTAQAIGGTVVAVSHAYGALSGILYLFICRVSASFKRVSFRGFRLK